METKKVASAQNHGRTVLVPQKTVIQFESGITTELATKPAVPSHRVAPLRQRAPTVREPIRLDGRSTTAERRSAVSAEHSSLDHDGGDLNELSMSNVDVVLSDNVMQAFLQNSPSAAHVSASSPLSAQAALIAKARVIEEMNRIQQRSYVTEQQRQQYMQAALGMDAPRLARTIIRSDRDAEEEVFSQAREKWAQERTGSAGSAGSEGGSSGGGLDLNGSVSFLTGGELLLLEEHLRREKAKADAAERAADAALQPPRSPVGTAKRVQETQASPSDDQEEDLDQTVRVLRKPSSAEKRQGDEDALFCKTVEEVERVRKRFIQKASLPLLSSLSNVEHLSSSSLDTGVGGSGAGSRRDSGLRPSSGSAGPGGGAEHASGPAGVIGNIGAGLRKHASRLFNSGVSALTRDNSVSTGVARVRSGDADDVPTQKKVPSTLSISTLDAEPSGTAGPYPILSPTQGKSPAKYILPKRAQRQSSAGSSGRDEVGGDVHREVYRVESSSLSPKPGRASSFGFDSPVEGRVKSIRVPAADSKNSTGTDYAADGFDSYHSTRQPQGRDKRPRSRDREEMGDSLSHQQLVASSIDMLIGSKFNSERDLDTADEEQRLMGSSLVLLQQQLDSAAAANSSYRNLYGAAQQQQQQGAGKAAPAHYSQAAATALATLSRPVSGGNQRLASVQAHAAGAGLTDLRTDSFKLAGGGGAGVQMLHTDDSTSSLGSNMFAFRAGSASNPPSAEKQLWQSGSTLTSGHNSSLALSSDAAGSVRQPVFRSTYDAPPQRQGASDGGSASGSLYSAYFSKPSTAETHESHLPVHLQPLEHTPRSNDPAAPQPLAPANVPHLHPLDLSVRVSATELLAAKISETPKDLPPTSARRQGSADRKRRDPQRAAAQADSAVHYPGYPDKQRSSLARLATADLDASLAASGHNTPGTGLGRTGGEGAAATRRAPAAGSTRAAILRKNAQLLLKSPLSDWISAGAHMQGQVPTQSVPAASETSAAADAPEERKRRDSKFSFEELQQADLQLAQSSARKSSPARSLVLSRGKTPKLAGEHRLGQVESLPALLPSLTGGDPSAVDNVYRSLNILSGHFAQLGPHSLGSSLQAEPRNATALRDSVTDASTPSSRLAAIDQELDDLLSGSRPATAAPTAPIAPTAQAADPPRSSVTTAGEMKATAGTSDFEPSANARHALRPARARALTSQSCVDPGTAQLDVHSEPNLSALRQAGAAVLNGAANSTAQTADLDAHLQRLALLKPAHSTSALPDYTRLAARRVGAGDALDVASPSSQNLTGRSNFTLNTLSSAVSSPGSAANSSAACTPSGLAVYPAADSESEAPSGLNAGATRATGASRTRVGNAAAPGQPPRGVAGAGHTRALSTDSSASNSTAEGANATVNATANSSLHAGTQQQRLGALAAALDAGDAVGKLMAQMMLGGSGPSSGHSSGVSSAANLRKR